MDFSSKDIVFPEKKTVVVLFPIQKPLSNIKWNYTQHGEVIVLAAVGTIIFGSSNTSRVRGTAFFVIGLICVMFFDHDYIHTDAEHPEGVHKSVFIHHFYELFANFGLSDHKIGVIVLIIAVCLDAAYAALARTLTASTGGAKSCYCLVTLFSLIGLFIISLVMHLVSVDQIPDSSGMANHDRVADSFDESKLKNFINDHYLIWLIIISFIHTVDYGLTTSISHRVGSHKVSRIAKQCVIVTGLISSIFWPSYTNTSVTPHYLSTGVIISILCILYASHLLTGSKSGSNMHPSSGHFIGYSMAGLPLFNTGVSIHCNDSLSLGSSHEDGGLWFHIRAILSGILNGQASRRIFAFLCLNLIFTFVELLYGVWTNSLGLISDGFHMLFDSAALIGGLYAAVVAHWKPTRAFSFGFHSAEILSGFINAIFLLVIAVFVFINALTRIHRPPEIKTDRLMAVSIIGLLVNLIGVIALGHAHTHAPGAKPCHSHQSKTHSHSHSHSVPKRTNPNQPAHAHNHHDSKSEQHSHMPSAYGHRQESDVVQKTTSEHHDHPDEHDCHHQHSHSDQHHHHHGHNHNHGHSHGSDESVEEDANLRGVYLHVLADTLGSVGVIFSSFLVSNYGWNIADPICSMFIACFIGLSSLPLLTHTLNYLSLKKPPHIHLKQLIGRIFEISEVISVRHPTAWSLTPSISTLCLTVKVTNEISEQVALARIKELIQTHYHSISHLTVQIEKDEFYCHSDAMGLRLPSILTYSRDQFVHNHHQGHQHHHHQQQQQQQQNNNNLGNSGLNGFCSPSDCYTVPSIKIG